MSVSHSLVEALKQALNGGEVPSKSQQAQTAPNDSKDGADKIAAMVDRISHGKAPKEDAGHAANAKPFQTVSNRSATPVQQQKDATSKSLFFFLRG